MGELQLTVNRPLGCGTLHCVMMPDVLSLLPHPARLQPSNKDLSNCVPQFDGFFVVGEYALQIVEVVVEPLRLLFAPTLFLHV